LWGVFRGIWEDHSIPLACDEETRIERGGIFSGTYLKKYYFKIYWSWESLGYTLFTSQKIMGVFYASPPVGERLR